MNKFFKFAFVAAAAFVGTTTVNAQTDDPNVATFSFGKMTTIEEPWTVGQSLDGVSYSQKSKDVTVSFSKGDGETGPQYVEVTYSKGGTGDVIQLNVGNTMSFTSESKTITKVVFSPVSKAKSPKEENDTKNYEMTEGTYVGPEGPTGEKYIWTGSTSNFTLKNLNNKGGMQFSTIKVTTADNATGIETVETINLQDGKVYDINGTYVGNGIKSVGKSGVYVVNGKKTVVKK